MLTQRLAKQHNIAKDVMLFIFVLKLNSDTIERIFNYDN